MNIYEEAYKKEKRRKKPTEFALKLLSQNFKAGWLAGL